MQVIPSGTIFLFAAFSDSSNGVKFGENGHNSYFAGPLKNFDLGFLLQNLGLKYSQYRHMR